MSKHHVRGADAAAEPATASAVAALMHALSTRSRVQILGCLAGGSCTVSELVETLDMQQSAVSHQLQVLRHLGLVAGERQGRNVLYALYDPHLADLLREAVAHTEHQRLGLHGHAETQTAAA